MSPPTPPDDVSHRAVTTHPHPLAERVRQLEARYQALSVASGHITWLTNAAGLVEEDLPQWRAFTGQTYEQILGAGWHAAVHPEDLPALQLRWNTALAAAAPFTTSVRVRRADGEYRTVQVRNVPVHGGDGAVHEWVGMGEDLTDRRQREQEITQRASQLTAIFAALPERISIFDAQGTAVQMNPAGQAHAGPQRGREHLTEFPQAYDLRTEAGVPLAVADLPLTRALRGEVVTNVELVMRGPDGQDELLQSSAAPYYDEHGHLAGVVAVTRDITAQRQTERAFANQAHETAAILEAITDAVYVYDAAGMLIRTNRATQETNPQITDAAYRDQSFEQRVVDVEFLTPEGHALSLAELPIARVLRGEILDGTNAVDTQIRYPHDSRVHILNTTGAPIRDSQGAIIGGVIVSRDVAERRQLERHTRDALQALLAMAHALVLPDHQDAANSVLTMARLAELARRVLGSERVALVSYDPATDAEEPLAIAGVTPGEEAAWRAALTNVHLRDFLAPERIAQLQAGESFLLDLTAPHLESAGMGGMIALITPMHIGDQLVGTLSLDFGQTPHAYQTEDFELARAVASLAALVIERERLIRARAAAQSEALALAETNRRMDEFLSIASHELRTPVTVIMAHVQLLIRRLQRSDTSLTQGQHRDLDMLHRTENQIVRLTRLLEDLVDTSRIRAGKLELRLDDCDLIAIVRTTIEAERLTNPERSILFPAHPSTIPLLADADRISQVVINYLTNALKYSDEDQPVQVRVDVTGDHARVRVTDHGPGIPAQHVDQIWEVFHRVPGLAIRSGSGVGLGLGLHICQMIIEHHGGQVGVTTHPGHGSTFWFTLPLAR